VKVSVYGRVPYAGALNGAKKWPVPAQLFDPHTGQHSAQQGLALLQRADELGFDWVSVAEHHYSPQQLSPNPMVLAGALSQRIARAKIALLGPTIPFLNPVRVAEELALLDNLTGGRIVAGLMRGAPGEYITYGINPGESRERFQEGLELIVRAWTTPEPFGWEGRFYQFRTVAVWPRPVQKPHPPIFMSGSTPESGEFAARLRLGLGLAFTTLPLACESARYYREQAEHFGWQPDPDQVLYRAQVLVAPTDDEARHIIEPYLEGAPRRAAQAEVQGIIAQSGYFGREAETHASRELVRPKRTLDEMIELGQILCGSPASVLAQARRIESDLGAGILDLSFQSGALPFEPALRSLELFGKHVLPMLHSSAGVGDHSSRRAPGDAVSVTTAGLVTAQRASRG
jgi:alkanesulfonate monooxygenase SsuD/methylene tetrahydromethanopterin reductase-like flavin-dependent oxidoreductase (luciferase family)